MHVVTATAPGSAHINPGQPGKVNNQDAIAARSFNGGQVIVLSDGCGSQPHSGTGADIGANIIAQTICRWLSHGSLQQLDWKKITKEVADALRAEVGKFAVSDGIADFEQAVVERFLFTATVLVVLGNEAIVASLGDGVVVVDDEVIIMEPPILNAPAYVGYLLLRNSAYHKDDLKSHLIFSVIRTVDLSTLEKSLIVGTDGFTRLIEEDLHHPALAQPKSLQRWLNAVTSEKIQNGSFVPSKCDDDVSLVLVRTKQAQRKLLESRREVVELKQEISSLRMQFVEVTAELDRSTLSQVAAEEKISDLEDQVATLGGKAAKADKFESELVEFREKVSVMRKKLKPGLLPFVSAADSLIGAWFPEDSTVLTSRYGSAKTFFVPQGNRRRFGR